MQPIKPYLAVALLAVTTAAQAVCLEPELLQMVTKPPSFAQHHTPPAGSDKRAKAQAARAFTLIRRELGALKPTANTAVPAQTVMLRVGALPTPQVASIKKTVFTQSKPWGAIHFDFHMRQAERCEVMWVEIHGADRPATSARFKAIEAALAARAR
jgi:hypothetical protein